MKVIASARSLVPDNPDEREVWHEDFKCMRRDGVLYSKFLGVGEWATYSSSGARRGLGRRLKRCSVTEKQRQFVSETTAIPLANS